LAVAKRRSEGYGGSRIATENENDDPSDTPRSVADVSLLPATHFE
jgi:hypothetical protein